MSSSWTWDAEIPGYSNAEGRAVTLAEMRKLVDQRVAESRRRLRTLADDLNAGRLSSGQLEERARTEIRSLHIELRLLAVGGRQHATLADWTRVNRALANEYAYLSQFCIAIAEGKLSAAQIRSRIVLYAGANAIEQFENGRLHAMKAIGCTEKRRVLGDRISCRTCWDEAKEDWVPIDRPGWVIGESECGPNCRCTMEYR